MTTSEITRLFNLTLLDEYEDEDPRDAVSQLQLNGNREIFEIAVSWLKDIDPLKRAQAASILGHLMEPIEPDNKQRTWHVKKPQWLFRDETFPLLLELIERECDALVLYKGILALSSSNNEDAIPMFIRYKDHSVLEVRVAVACALGRFTEMPSVISALVALTRDKEFAVRIQAVVALEFPSSVDSREVGDALLDRLLDLDEEIRQVATMGLAGRGDLRLLPTLREMLTNPRLNRCSAKVASLMLGLSKIPGNWLPLDYENTLDRRFGRAQ
jgi:HEAT repeats